MKETEFPKKRFRTHLVTKKKKKSRKKSDHVSVQHKFMTTAKQSHGNWNTFDRVKIHCYSKNEIWLAKFLNCYLLLVLKIYKILYISNKQHTDKTHSHGNRLEESITGLKWVCIKIKRFAMS